MGICGASSKLKKDQAIVNVKYNETEEADIIMKKNEKLSDVINKIKLNLDNDYDFYDSKQNLISDKINEEIEKIFDTNNPISITIKKFSLQIPKNCREYLYNKALIVGTITFNNPLLLGIFIYYVKSKQIMSYEYPFRNYPQLKFINKFSAFCNANNSLYISGGETESGGNKNFIEINLGNIRQNELSFNNLISLNNKRYWHSMIFIPEKYIFFIGGPNEKEVELYDIEKKEMKIDSKLNYERCEPSLILVNNKFLYCICGFLLENNFVDTIEKCNLFRKERKWEIVNYQIKTKEENATPSRLIISFFGVSYINDNIILIGDKENNNIINPNYLLKPNEKDIDIIEEYGYIESNNTRLFFEKCFIPINENESLALPFKSGVPKMLILNNNDGNIKEMILKENNEENEINTNNY